MSTMEYNVSCLIWGNGYSYDYVNILHSMIERNFNKKFNFFCYTDSPNNKKLKSKIIQVKLDDDNAKHYFKKLYIISNKYEKPFGYNLYFDLDLVIHNNITPLFDDITDKGLTTINCKWNPNNMEYLKNCWVNGNSSVTGWINKNEEVECIYDHYLKTRHFWDSYIKYDDIYATDDDFMLNNLYESNQFTGDKIYHYRYGLNPNDNGFEYKENSIVCIFPQTPKPHEVDELWVKENWKL